MPTYQYVCTNSECGNAFELVQSFTDAPASECPVCGGPVRKVFSSVGVVFKGSGFYRTDSRAESRSAESKNGSGSSTATKTAESTSPSKSSESTSSSSTSSSKTASSNGSSAGSGSAARAS